MAAVYRLRNVQATRGIEDTWQWKTCQKNGRTADEGSLAALLAALLTAAYLAAHYLATALSGALLATHLGGWTSTRCVDVAPE